MMLASRLRYTILIQSEFDCAGARPAGNVSAGADTRRDEKKINKCPRDVVAHTTSYRRFILPATGKYELHLSCIGWIFKDF